MDHTIDHIGPITSTVADNAPTLEVIAGADWRDPQSVRADPDAGTYAAAAGRGIQGLQVGIIRDALEPSRNTFATSQKTLGSLGAEIVPVAVPLWTDSWTLEMRVINVGLWPWPSEGQGYGHLGRVDVNPVATDAAHSRLGLGISRSCCQPSSSPLNT